MKTIAPSDLMHTLVCMHERAQKTILCARVCKYQVCQALRVDLKVFLNFQL